MSKTGCAGVERSGPSPTEEDGLSWEDGRTDGHSLIYGLIGTSTDGRTLKGDVSRSSRTPTSAEQPHVFTGGFVDESEVRNERPAGE